MKRKRHGPDQIIAKLREAELSVTPLAAHEPGIGSHDWTAAAGSQTTYRHGDQIGSTRAISNQPTSGDPTVTGRIVYTAFGERVWSDGAVGTRYQYAGAWGYQTMPEYASGMSHGLGGAPGDEVPFVHVGHRWYDPATGRFLQRDPIGIRGGLNIYAYVFAIPTSEVDPLGLAWWNPFDYAPIARATIWATDKFNAWTDINLDCPAAVNEASRGFRQAAFAAAGAATGLAAPGTVGLCIGFGGEVVQHTGATTGNSDLDAAIGNFTRGAGIGGLRPSSGGSAVGGTLRGFPGSVNGPYITIR